MNQQQSLMSSFLNAHQQQQQQPLDETGPLLSNTDNLFKFNSFSNVKNGYSKPWEMLNTPGGQGSSNYGQDSLLGMAATLFNSNNNNNVASMTNNNNAMMASFFPPLQGQAMQQQQQSTRPEDIMDQVLSELSDDLFDGPAVSDDIFDMEPVPINEQRMTMAMGNMSTITSEQTRLAILEDTLNQVLSGTGNDDFGLAPSMPSINENNKRNFMDLNMDFMMPSPKKQRVMPSTTSDLMGSASTVVPIAPTLSSPTPATPASMMSMEQVENQGDVLEGEDEDEDSKNNRFRPYQAEQWSEKFEELLQFKKERGHCCVPHTFQENPSLARWVKRQRYQYKLKNEGKPSTMTDERVVALSAVGFVWDSHGAAWEERWNELSDYRIAHGHTNVPSNHPINPQLATWVKCQRRQYKLFWDGKPSNMTLERITKLEQLGFEWELRGSSKNKPQPLSSLPAAF